MVLLALTPSHPSWWWTVGLDGILGGVLGGLVTGLVLWATIRHERNLSDDVEVRAAAAAFTGRMLRLNLGSIGSARQDWAQWIAEVFTEGVLLESLAARRHPVFSSDLGLMTQELADAGEAQTDSRGEALDAIEDRLAAAHAALDVGESLSESLRLDLQAELASIRQLGTERLTDVTRGLSLIASAWLRDPARYPACEERRSVDTIAHPRYSPRPRR